jgi:hypothetical protein
MTVEMGCDIDRECPSMWARVGGAAGSEKSASRRTRGGTVGT